MSKIPLNDIKKKLIYQSLANKSFYDTGIEFGFDKYYPNKLALTQAVMRIRKEVVLDPIKFAVSNDVVEMVEAALKDRFQNPASTKIMISGAEINLDELDEKALVLRGKKAAWLLLNKKLNMLARSPKELGKTNLAALANVAGIAFDKGQIVKGEATENIAIRAKIDQNIDPLDALSEVMKRRDTNG